MKGLNASYDATGNLQALSVGNGPASATYDYAWDELGRLTKATRIGTQSNPSETDIAEQFVYGAGGERVITNRQAANGAVDNTVQVFDSLVLEHANFPGGDGVDYERDSKTEHVYLSAPGMLLAHVFFDDGDTLPIVTGGTQQHLFFLFGDTLGSTSFVVDRDSSELVERVTYQAYGAVESDFRPARWQSFREDVRYTGHWDDAQVGLIYFGARYYSPQLARFISPDPLTVQGLAGDPNPYAFVGGSPLGSVDPFGLQCEDPGSPACQGQQPPRPSPQPQVPQVPQEPQPQEPAPDQGEPPTPQPTTPPAPPPTPEQLGNAASAAAGAQVQMGANGLASTSSGNVLLSPGAAGTLILTPGNPTTGGGGFPGGQPGISGAIPTPTPAVGGGGQGVGFSIPQSGLEQAVFQHPVRSGFVVFGVALGLYLGGRNLVAAAGTGGLAALGTRAFFGAVSGATSPTFQAQGAATIVRGAALGAFFAIANPFGPVTDNALARGFLNAATGNAFNAALSGRNPSPAQAVASGAARATVIQAGVGAGDSLNASVVRGMVSAGVSLAVP